MKKISKLLIALSLLISLFSLFACSSFPTEENSSSDIKNSVKFTMQNVNTTSSNVLFSSIDGQTPSKVAISYRKSGETAVISTIFELTAFGSSYITDDVLSLHEGSYEVTRFDVLNDSGTTIYSTPVSKSKVATSLNIGTTLNYGFTVNEGKISTVCMQVVAVDEDTDPADFGHTSFTFETVSYNRFYIEALIIDDSIGWTYTSANVSVANSEGTIIKTTTIKDEVNRIPVVDDDSYTIIVSKDGYRTQVLNFTKDELAVYKAKIMVIKLKKAEETEESEKSFYMEALVSSGSTWAYTDAIVTINYTKETIVETNTINGKKNKITVSNDTFYTIKVSKSGYITQTFSFTKDKLSLYENEALKVKLEVKKGYQFINKNMTWTDAKAYCENIGGYLLTITSPEENAYIAELLATNGNPQCWAGGTDDSLEGAWKWVSGEKWDYTNWGSGQPDDPGNAQEDYLQLGYSDNKWNDANNNTLLPFICEWNSEEEMLNAYYTITYDINGGSGSVASVSTIKLDSVTIASGCNLSKTGLY